MDVDAVMMERRAASWESTSSVGCIGSKGSWKALFDEQVWDWEEEEGVVEVDADAEDAVCEEVGFWVWFNLGCRAALWVWWRLGIDSMTTVALESVREMGYRVMALLAPACGARGVAIRL